MNTNTEDSGCWRVCWGELRKKEKGIC